MAGFVGESDLSSTPGVWGKNVTNPKFASPNDQGPAVGVLAACAPFASAAVDTTAATDAIAVRPRRGEGRVKATLPLRTNGV